MPQRTHGIHRRKAGTGRGIIKHQGSAETGIRPQFIGKTGAYCGKRQVATVKVPVSKNHVAGHSAFFFEYEIYPTGAGNRLHTLVCYQHLGTERSAN